MLPVKGQLYTEGPLEGAVTAPAILMRNVQVEGLWPTLEYLMDLRPWPALLPVVPEKRAAMRTMCEQMMLDPSLLGTVQALYQDMKEWPFGSLQLIDVIVAAYGSPAFAPTSPDNWPRRVRLLLREWIEAQEAE